MVSVNILFLDEKDIISFFVYGVIVQLLLFAEPGPQQ
jgi:hypothetical protein